MPVYQFEREQVVKTSLDELWDFISSPANLARITPDSMGFHITSGGNSEKMYEGLIISYRIRPIPLFFTTWVTEITHVQEKHYFVDEQRVGPYRLWHHEHLLKPLENGILMKDKVSYVPPLGLLGRIANALFIKKKLIQIFDYREKAIREIFNRSIT
jgi:ligand-binding SRPBCC domain-containing protein